MVGVAAAAGIAAGLAVGGVGKTKTKKRNGVGNTLETEDQRSQSAGVVARWTKPVVIAGPGLFELGQSLQRRLGCELYDEDKLPTISLERFKSNDSNIRINWQRIVGRRIVFLFDTVDQDRLFEQLSLLQALQGFAVPDSEDKETKWKTYVNRGSYSWARAAHITIVLPWYRPCQMERTSRWQLVDGKWDNSDAQGEYLDLPTAQYLARLLATPGSVPPLPGPSCALDGMPIAPLWRPPVELLFVELHEEAPIQHAVSDLGATVRMKRFVPFFLDRFKLKPGYSGQDGTYVLFPDKGAFNRYYRSVVQRLGLASDHIVYIKKTRVGESTSIESKLFYEDATGGEGERSSFSDTDHILIIDDFTNSGGTLFGAVNLVKKMVAGGKTPTVTIFVSHLVATYDSSVCKALLDKLHAFGPSCNFSTTNTIPSTTNLLKDDPQVEVLDIADFLATLV